MNRTESDGARAMGELISVHDGVDETHEGGTAAFFDELFAALAHRRRRALLRVLQEEGEMDVASLAGHVVAEDRAETIHAVPDPEVDRARISLYHQHLPRLDDTGLVDFDADAGLVSVTEPGARLDLSPDPVR